ncbi:MAG: flavin reductase family protein [Lachnospiraceae bacterium]|nr:flavin reductase family protein [Lachnospiraceae bacterium]
MGRQYWKPGNMLNPVPAVLISSMDEDGKTNIMTAAWTGNLCSDPVMVSVSIRPQRYSYGIIKKTGEFVLNLSNRALVRAVDYCGVKSGRDSDKFAELRLTRSPSRFVKAPGIGESPVSLECRVEKILPLGTHDVFIARVLSTDVDEQYLDEKGRFDLDRADLIAYSHGEYYALGEKLGKFGFSVKKPQRSHKARRQ